MLGVSSHPVSPPLGRRPSQMYDFVDDDRGAAPAPGGKTSPSSRTVKPPLGRRPSQLYDASSFVDGGEVPSSSSEDEDEQAGGERQERPAFAYDDLEGVELDEEVDSDAERGDERAEAAARAVARDPRAPGLLEEARDSSHLTSILLVLQFLHDGGYVGAHQKTALKRLLILVLVTPGNEYLSGAARPFVHSLLSAVRSLKEDGDLASCAESFKQLAHQALTSLFHTAEDRVTHSGEGGGLQF